MYVNEGIPSFWGGRLPPAGMGVIPDCCGWGWGLEKESPSGCPLHEDRGPGSGLDRVNVGAASKKWRFRESVR